MRLMLMMLVAMLAGCASPGEIRESGYNRTVAVKGQLEEVADCTIDKLDEAVHPFGNAMRKTPTGRTILTRNPEQTVAVTDIKQVGDQVEARIAIGPAVFTQNSFAAAIEKAVRACGR